MNVFGFLITNICLIKLEKKHKAYFFQHIQIYHIDDLSQFVKTNPEQVYQCFFEENHRIDDTNA